MICAEENYPPGKFCDDQMPRYSRRYRRNSRRRSRTLTSYSIATRTNARAQSRQIYALNRKIRRIESRTRPETKVSQTAPLVVTPTLHQDTYPSTGGLSGYAYSTLYHMPLTDIDGLFARQNEAKVYFNANYVTISSDVQPVTYRVLVVQQLMSINYTYDSYIFGSVWNDVNPNDQSEGLLNWNANIPNLFARDAIFGPLQNGVTRSFRILADRKYVLSYQRPQIAARINCKRLMNYGVTEITNGNMGQESENRNNQGLISVMVLCYGSNPHTYRVTGKIAYTDS